MNAGVRIIMLAFRVDGKLCELADRAECLHGIIDRCKRDRWMSLLDAFEDILCRRMFVEE